MYLTARSHDLIWRSAKRNEKGDNFELQLVVSWTVRWLNRSGTRCGNLLRRQTPSFITNTEHFTRGHCCVFDASAASSGISKHHFNQRKKTIIVKTKPYKQRPGVIINNAHWWHLSLFTVVYCVVADFSHIFFFYGFPPFDGARRMWNSYSYYRNACNVPWFHTVSNTCSMCLCNVRVHLKLTTFLLCF